MRKFSIIQDFFQDGPPHHDDWCNGRDLDFGATIIKYHMETSSLSATCEDVQSFSALTSAVVSSGPRICLHDAVTCVFFPQKYFSIFGIMIMIHKSSHTRTHVYHGTMVSMIFQLSCEILPNLHHSFASPNLRFGGSTSGWRSMVTRAPNGLAFGPTLGRSVFSQLGNWSSRKVTVAYWFVSMWILLVENGLLERRWQWNDLGLLFAWYIWQSYFCRICLVAWSSRGIKE